MIQHLEILKKYFSYSLFEVKSKNEKLILYFKSVPIGKVELTSKGYEIYIEEKQKIHNIFKQSNKEEQHTLQDSDHNLREQYVRCEIEGKNIFQKHLKEELQEIQSYYKQFNAPVGFNSVIQFHVSS